MQKKKVVIVSPAFPYRGGQALVESHLFSALTDAGFDCQTITYTLLYPSIFFPGKTQYDESKIVAHDHRDKITRMISSVNPLTWLKTAKHINKIKPDAVVFVWWTPFFAPCFSTIAKRVKKGCGAKIIFFTENYISHEKRKLDRKVTKWALKNADSFVCQSDYIISEIRKDFPSKPVYRTRLAVYDCYDFEKYTQESARKELGINTKQTILFFGLIRPYKGLDNLIRIFPKVLQQKPDTTLLIVGECYEDVKKYEDLIKEVGIEKSTIFINKYIHNEDLELYFKAADFTCLPYNSATQSGITVMSYGFKIPVVVTNVGGLSEFVDPGESGMIIPPHDPEALLQACFQMMEEVQQRSFAEGIIRVSKRLGYGNIGEIFTEICKSN